MTQAINLIVFAIMTLANVVMTFIGFIDRFLAALMTSAGIPPNAQLILLVVAAVVLVIFAVRLLGGVFAWLIIVLLVLLLLHKAFPGMEIPQGHTLSWLQAPGKLVPSPPIHPPA
jgi:hypothetical protein